MKYVFTLITGMILGACVSTDANWFKKIFKKNVAYKIYRVRPDWGGIYRERDKETIKFKELMSCHGGKCEYPWVCMRDTTLQGLASSCKAGKE